MPSNRAPMLGSLDPDRFGHGRRLMPSDMRRSRTRAIKRGEREVMFFDLEWEGFEVIEVIDFERKRLTCFSTDDGGTWT